MATGMGAHASGVAAVAMAVTVAVAVAVAVAVVLAVAGALFHGRSVHHPDFEAPPRQRPRLRG